MAVSLPDVIGEYIATPGRFETGGIQYAGYFEPAKIAPEQVAHLYLFLQNTLDVPMTARVNIIVPQAGGLFRGGKPILAVEEESFQLELRKFEAGLLILPVTTEHPKEGEHALSIEFKVSTKERGQRVRPAQSQSKLDKRLIESPVGLNLVSTLGATFTEQSVKKAPFVLKISGPPQSPERAPKLTHSYQSLWGEENIEIFRQAVHELNLRQVKLKNELTVEALFVTLYAASVSRFADAGLPLRIGEAMVLAKILTYTCQLFLNNPNYYNGLLIPIWERALDAGIDTTNALQVIRTVGYYHVLKLAAAISFTLVAQAVGRHYWSLEERQAVTNFIADSIEEAQEVDEEFLYLPLLMAGTHICHKLKLEDEDVQQTLALMRKARQARTYLFEDEDMAQANKIYNHILKNAAQSS